MAATAIASTAVPPTPSPVGHWSLANKEPSRSTRSSSSSSSSANSLSGNSSNRRCAFSRKCSRLIKEHRARFYIMRRCVTLLICSRDFSDS